MNRLVILSLVLFSLWGTGAAMAQEKMSRKDSKTWLEADELLAVNDFLQAKELYLNLCTTYPEHAELHYLAGICHFNLRQYREQAMPYFEKAANREYFESYYYLGICLHEAERFAEAKTYLERYLNHWQKSVIGRDEVQRQLAMIEQAIALMQQPLDVEIENLGPGINSEYADYAPLVSVDQTTLFYTSRKPGSTGGKLDPNGNYFEDIYKADKEGVLWGYARNLGNGINTNSHDACVGLTPDGTQMIIYRTNKDETGGDLYGVTYEGDHWGKPVKLSAEINSDYQESAAAFTNNGRTIFFSSNRPGGMGGKDLYRVVRLPNGSWSLPLNLGAPINTPYDEEAPFVHADGKTLYFSSRGHATMGGYDIFKSILSSDKQWSPPENIGYPINTVHDDIYFVLSGSGTHGYFSSNAHEGFGDQDLFTVKFKGKEKNLTILKGRVLDAESGEPLEADVSLFNLDTDELEGAYLSNYVSGKFLVIMNPWRPYELLIEAIGYEEQILEVEYQETEGFNEIKTDFLLKKEGN